jgi:hypothetical protein
LVFLEERVAAMLPEELNRYEHVDYLAARNSHPRDKSIRFEVNGHKYECQFFGSESEFTSEHVLSVSGLVGAFFPEFDADATLAKIKNGRAYRPGTQYYGRSDEDIKTAWARNSQLASEQGTKYHYLAECFYNGMDVAPFADFRVMRQFLRFHAQHVLRTNLVPFRTEMRLRSCNALRLAGTVDALFVDANYPPPEKCDGELRLHMRDWKFSKEIKRESQWENGVRACAQLPNCNFSRYALQQNLYKHLLETYYAPFSVDGRAYSKIRVVSMQLVVCHDTRDDFEVVHLPDLEGVVKKMLAERAQQLAAARGSALQGH